MRKIKSSQSGKSTPQILSFPENPYDALEEACTILGFNENQLRFLSDILLKTDSGYLDFYVGDLCIEFHKVYEEEEINLCISVKEDTERAVTYPLKLPHKTRKA